MTPHEAYQLGLLPWLVGVPFEAFELAQAAAAAAGDAPNGQIDEAFDTRLRAEIDALRARNTDTVASVLRVEEIARAAGFEVPARPQVVAEYRDWFTGVKRAVTETLDPDSPEGAALVVGFFVGEIYLTLALGQVARSLFEAAPKNPFLVSHVESLADSQKKLLPRIGRAMDHDELPAPALAIGKRLIIDLETPLRTLASLRDQLARLDAYAAALGQAFAPA